MVTKISGRVDGPQRPPLFHRRSDPSTNDEDLKELSKMYLQSRWTELTDLIYEDKDIQVYRPTQPQLSLPVYYSKGSFEYSADTLLNSLLYSPYRQQWDPYAPKIDIVDQRSDGNSVMYAIAALPWPLSHRDYVYQRRLKQFNHGDQTCYVIMCQAMHHKNAPSEEITSRIQSLVRVETFTLKLCIQATGPNSCKFYMEYEDDTNFSVPNSMVNILLTFKLPSFLTQLKAACGNLSQYTSTLCGENERTNLPSRKLAQIYNAEHNLLKNTVKSNRNSDTSVYRTLKKSSSNEQSKSKALSMRRLLFSTSRAKSLPSEDVLSSSQFPQLIHPDTCVNSIGPEISKDKVQVNNDSNCKKHDTVENIISFYQQNTGLLLEVDSQCQIVVLNCDRNSEAFKYINHGIQVGSVVTSVNGERVQQSNCRTILDCISLSSRPLNIGFKTPKISFEKWCRDTAAIHNAGNIINVDANNLSANYQNTHCKLSPGLSPPNICLQYSMWRCVLERKNIRLDEYIQPKQKSELTEGVGAALIRELLAIGTPLNQMYICSHKTDLNMKFSPNGAGDKLPTNEVMKKFPKGSVLWSVDGVEVTALPFSYIKHIIQKGKGHHTIYFGIPCTPTTLTMEYIDSNGDLEIRSAAVPVISNTTCGCRESPQEVTPEKRQGCIEVSNNTSLSRKITNFLRRRSASADQPNAFDNNCTNSNKLRKLKPLINDPSSTSEPSTPCTTPYTFISATHSPISPGSTNDLLSDNCLMDYSHIVVNESNALWVWHQIRRLKTDERIFSAGSLLQKLEMFLSMPCEAETKNITASKNKVAVQAHLEKRSAHTHVQDPKSSSLIEPLPSKIVAEQVLHKMRKHEALIHTIKTRYVQAQSAIMDYKSDKKNHNAPNNEWRFGQSYLGVDTYWKPGTDDSIWFKIEGDLSGVDIFHTLAVIQEVDIFHTWVPLCSESKILHRSELVDVYAYLKMAIPLMNRDAIFHAIGINACFEHQCILIIGSSEDDKLLPKEVKASQPLRATGWGADRLEINAFRAIIEPFSRTSSRMTIVGNIDLHCAVPKSLLNMGIKQVAGVLLYLIRREAERIERAKAEGVPNVHLERIQSDPHNYYSWLQAMVDNWFAQKPQLGSENTSSGPLCADINSNVQHTTEMKSKQCDIITTHTCWVYTNHRGDGSHGQFVCLVQHFVANYVIQRTWPFLSLILFTISKPSSFLVASILKMIYTCICTWIVVTKFFGIQGQNHFLSYIRNWIIGVVIVYDILSSCIVKMWGHNVTCILLDTFMNMSSYTMSHDDCINRPMDQIQEVEVFCLLICCIFFATLVTILQVAIAPAR